MTDQQDPSTWVQQQLIEESERLYELEQATDEDTALPKGAIVSQPNRARSVVYSIRLLPEQVERIEQVAKRLGVPASTVAHGWVQLGLAHAESDATVAGAVERLEADVRRLRELIA